MSNLDAAEKVLDSARGSKGIREVADLVAHAFRAFAREPARLDVSKTLQALCKQEGIQISGYGVPDELKLKAVEAQLQKREPPKPKPKAEAPKHVCASCKYIGVDAHTPPCRWCHHIDNRPHWEPKEPPAPERTCKTCKHSARRNALPPCNHCSAARWKGFPEWEPKEPVKPAQGYKLEAGCKVIARNPGRSGECGEIVCMLGDDRAAVRFPHDGYDVICLGQLEVTKPAPPEVGDWVRYPGGHTTVEGTTMKGNVWIRGQLYDRSDITIRAKARHAKQEQG